MSAFKLLNQPEVVKSMQRLSSGTTIQKSDAEAFFIAVKAPLHVHRSSSLVSLPWGESGLFFKESTGHTKSDPNLEYAFGNANQGFSTQLLFCILRFPIANHNGLRWWFTPEKSCVHSTYLSSIVFTSIFCKTKPSTFCLAHILSCRRWSLDTCRTSFFLAPVR